jgi:hypothetical protein
VGAGANPRPFVHVATSPGLLGSHDLRGEKSKPLSSRPGDDLRYLNGDDPVRNVRPWAPVARDEWDRIEAKVRREVRVTDDFVQIPFPRIAGAAEGAIVAAVEQYKHEAAIVDPRLFHEVTLDQKAAALSDLCEQIRNDTGIQLTAGPSVADEKVTVFCEKLPLREVMRQLSRPFGYTWVRSGKQGDYRYELVQDLRSQLEEESLRNRDRDAALLALDREIDRYRLYLNLSPDEALARARTASPGEKALLTKLARPSWGLMQLYARLSPLDLAVLRSGQPLLFSPAPAPGQHLLPPDLAQGVLQSQRDLRLLKRGSGFQLGSPEGLPEGQRLTVMPDARPVASLILGQNELGQFTLGGGIGFTLGGSPTRALAQWQEAAASYAFGGDSTFAVGDFQETFVRQESLATGANPASVSPQNGVVNASLAGDPSLRPRISVQPQSSCRPDLTPSPFPTREGESPSLTSNRTTNRLSHPSPPRGGAGGGVGSGSKVTAADVLEALHLATGMPIVADYYTRLYAPEAVSVRNQPLFTALNHLADTMHRRWRKDGRWLQFRSATYYHDRLKEVPNRLLSRWAASRREHRALTLDDLLEIAQLSDTQLNATEMAEGAKECWGLAEWDLARARHLRPHLRYLATFTPSQRQQAMRAAGLAFTQMSLPQQQQFLAFALGAEAGGQKLEREDLASATLHVQYTVPGGLEWAVPEAGKEGSAAPGSPMTLAGSPEDSRPRLVPRPPLSEQERESLLQTSRRFNPRETEAQVLAHLRPEPDVRITYTLGASKARQFRFTASMIGSGLHTP